MPGTVQYVDIGSTQPDGSFRLRARCVLRDDDMTIEGRDAKMLRHLEDGVYDEEGTLRKKTDGPMFLEALQAEYRTPYLYATSIQEGEPSLEDWNAAPV